MASCQHNDGKRVDTYSVQIMESNLYIMKRLIFEYNLFFIMYRSRRHKLVTTSRQRLLLAWLAAFFASDSDQIPGLSTPGVTIIPYSLVSSKFQKSSRESPIADGININLDGSVNFSSSSSMSQNLTHNVTLVRCLSTKERRKYQNLSI